MCMTWNNLSELNTKQNCNRNKGFQGQFNYIAFVNLEDLHFAWHVKQKFYEMCREQLQKI